MRARRASRHPGRSVTSADMPTAKLVEHWAVIDQLSMLTQLGFIPRWAVLLRNGDALGRHLKGQCVRVINAGLGP